MAIEIERKFLVKNDSFKAFAEQTILIEQGYLAGEGDGVVRVRVTGENAVITIKSGNAENGIARYEWEYPVPVEDACEMMKMCGSGIIRKTRYVVPAGKHVFEVDVFHGDNEGVVIAEVELSAEDEIFDHPDWLGAEVTMKKCYYNAFLARHPYKEWKKA